MISKRLFVPFLSILLLSIFPIASLAIQGEPIPGRDIVLEGDPGLIVSLNNSGSVQVELKAGFWRISTQCHRGTGCAPAAFTGLTINGKPVELRGIAKVIDLRLGNGSKSYRVGIEVQAVKVDGDQTYIDGRAVKVLSSVMVMY